MDKTIEKTLSLLGCSPLEIKFYLAAFRLGPAKIPAIAKAARLKRSTAYLLSDELIKRGLLLEDHKEYANSVYPLEPEQLLRLLSGRQRALRRQEVEFEQNLPEIRSLYQASEIRPKIRAYEGNSGLLQVWQDILSTKNEILLWTNQQTENLFFGQINHDKFIKERLAKKIPIRVLATATPESVALQKTDEEFFRRTKILPQSTVFSAETYLYDNKIAMLDYNKDIIGIIIESVPLAAAQKAIFNTTWNLID